MDLAALRTPSGEAALSAAAGLVGGDPLAAAAALRSAGVPPDLASLALTQATLRRQAAAKFGPAAAAMFFTRPGLFHYTRTPAQLQENADDLFDALARGIVKVEINQRWPLAQAADAHRALEARNTTGATLLEP